MIRSLYRTLRSVYRRFIGYPLRTFWTLRTLQQKRLINSIHHHADTVVFDYGIFRQLRARRFPHSDLEVLQQIILDQEYGFAVEWLRATKKEEHALRIVDAGANVGYTSLYFLAAFPGASLVAIEPDPDNYKVLEHNLRCASSGAAAQAVQAALLSRSGISVTIDRQGGDKKDWSFSVRPSTAPTGVNSIAVKKILDRTGWDRLDILKIDIEGSEADVFSEQADLSYLQHTRLVLVEIHDDKADRQLIHRLLSRHGFSIEERSE
ncbi:MAG: FkbM family methyltransferase, partial [Sphingomonadales bacterium]